MHKVVVIASPGVVGFDLLVPIQVFRRVPKDRYDVRVAGLRPGTVFSGHGLEFVASGGLDALHAADTIILPGLEDVDAQPSPELLEELKAAHRRGTRIASICTGAFLLAGSGLLDGRSATTHWAFAQQLATRFPKVKVDARVLYIDHGDVVTSAGATAGIDMCLHLVRSDHGEKVANFVARALVASPHRSGGQCQFIPRPMPPSRTRPLGQLCNWAIEHLADAHTVTSLAERAGLTPRSLSRRFQDEMGMSPLQWLIEQRVRKAQAMLESTDLSVENIAYQCGFPALLPCRRHFRKLVGVSPQEYRRSFTGLRQPHVDRPSRTARSPRPLP